MNVSDEEAYHPVVFPKIWAIRGFLNRSWWRYGLAVLTMGIGWGICAGFQWWLTDELLTLVLVLVILVNAWLGGVWLGLLATVFGIVASDYFLVEPRLRFYVEGAQDMVRLSLFAAAGVFISLLSESLYRLRRRAETEADKATQMQESLQVCLEDSKECQEHKLARESLRREQEFLRKVIDAVPDLIFVKDWEGRFVLGNEALARAYGTTVHDVVGRTDADFNSDEKELRHFQKDDREVMTTRAAKFILEEKVTYADGQEHWLSTVKVPLLNEDGSCNQVLGVSADITEQKRIAEALRQAKQKAEAANAAKDQFLATLSHELRTPLTPVLAAASNLEKSLEFSSGVREDLQMIRRNVELEARLIDDLLDLTRIVRGKLELRLQPVDVCAVLRHAVEICGGDIRAKRLHMEMREEPHERWVRGDSSRLQQVFWNLLKNAIKFTPEGGHVWIRTAEDGPGRIRIEVEDDGIGIENRLLARIFSAFEQGSSQITRRFGGLGLGLAICRTIVELHGGSITAESQGVGKGAKFRVSLPAMSQGESAGVQPSTDENAALAQVRSEGRILLVEDHVDTARVMRRLLASRGYEVTLACGVQAAMQRAEEGRFDLVVSDLGLPDGSGHDLMRQLKRRYGLKGIAISGYGMEEDIRKSLDSGFAEHLTKPVDLRMLEALIVKVMG